MGGRRRAAKRRQCIAGGVSRRGRWAPSQCSAPNGAGEWTTWTAWTEWTGDPKVAVHKGARRTDGGAGGRMGCGLRRPDAALDAREACFARERAARQGRCAPALSLREMPKLCRATALQRRRAAGPPARGLPKWQIGEDMYRSGVGSLALERAYTRNGVHGKCDHTIVEGVGSGSAVFGWRGNASFGTRHSSRGRRHEEAGRGWPRGSGRGTEGLAGRAAAEAPWVAREACGRCGFGRAVPARSRCREGG